MEIGALRYVQSGAINEAYNQTKVSDGSSFGKIFDSAFNMLNETQALENKAEEMEIQMALGDAVNTHDLAIAQTKASLALQYTVAVRDKFLEAYNQIMNMQV